MSGASSQQADAAPTDQLLTWASQLQFSDLPADAVEMLRDDVVDGLGCGLFGSTLPAPSDIRETLLQQSGGGTGPCTVWGTLARTAALDAVAMNAAAISGFELDDYCDLVRGAHGAATVYPAILAVSELTHAVTGQDFMAAAAAGWETSVRISTAMGPSVFNRGWYLTPMYAPLGSAVAAGRALHLNPEQMQACFELALLQTGGLVVMGQVEIGKAFASGESVRSGLLCALLAARGCRGPRHAYDDPKKGFAAAFGAPEERDDDALVVKPGDSLACQNIGFKGYASSGPGQVATDIIFDFMDANPTVGPETVESVQVRINATNAANIGGPYVPSDVKHAQFNLPYCVATQLLEGDNSVDQFREALLADERILELSRRIQVIPDPNVGRSRLIRNEAYVTMRLKDGTVLEGHAETKRKLDRAGIRKKFAGLAAYAIAPEAAAKLVETVDHLEQIKDAAVLAEHLAVASRDA